ncbi:MAG: hypothetical protein AAB300_00290, partial [Nitrospirota bacterium]
VGQDEVEAIANGIKAINRMTDTVRVADRAGDTAGTVRRVDDAADAGRRADDVVPTGTPDGDLPGPPRGPPGGYVPNPNAARGTGLSDDIANTFSDGQYSAEVLQQYVTLYRHSGGVSSPTGRFLTTQQTVDHIGSPVDAQRLLNLPAGATAEQINAFVVPKGTTIYYGRVAGGGEISTHIFIQDPSVLRAVEP